MNKNETHEQQVMRILNQMVASGEVVTKKSSTGELLYALAPKVKCKPAETKSTKAKRSRAALKAWATRRKKTTVKCKQLKVEAKKEVPKVSHSERAKKAWNTRRLQATKTATKLCKTSCNKAKAVKCKNHVTGQFDNSTHANFQPLLEQVTYIKTTYLELAQLFQTYEDAIKRALLPAQSVG